MSIKVKSKIPWFKILAVVAIVLLLIVLAGVAFPGLGAAMLAGASGAGDAIWGFFSPALTQVAIAIIITAGTLILVTQRKYFFAKKYNVIGGGVSTPSLQGGLIQTNPLATPTVAQQAIPQQTAEVVQEQ